ncbi:MAG: c-type cytochrome [Gemmatimonadales bacterium]
MRLRLLIPACIIALPGTILGQASGGGPEEATRSTRSRVYTAQQADKGSEIYALQCVSCHTAATHTGPAFAAKWHQHPLSELFEYITSEMPKQDPGSLSRSEYALVLAYLLKLNGMPPGSEELPTDPAALRKIRIELNAARDTSPR